MTVNGKTPSLAIIVHVEEAMFHCGKAVVRSNLWSPERWGPVDGLPTYGEALVDHGKLSIAVGELDEGLREHEATTLY